MCSNTAKNNTRPSLLPSVSQRKAPGNLSSFGASYHQRGCRPLEASTTLIRSSSGSTWIFFPRALLGMLTVLRHFPVLQTRCSDYALVPSSTATILVGRIFSRRGQIRPWSSKHTGYRNLDLPKSAAETHWSASTRRSVRASPCSSNTFHSMLRRRIVVGLVSDNTNLHEETLIDSPL